MAHFHQPEHIVRASSVIQVDALVVLAEQDEGHAALIFGTTISQSIKLDIVVEPEDPAEILGYDLGGNVSVVETFGTDRGVD